jgi:(p)ppGpp synthase/HD superfamily hydrolase
MPPHPPLPRWNDAVAFVAVHHGDDLRKGTRIPYVTHLMAVAETLAYHYPEHDDLIVAGLLHDVVEDTHATFDAVAERFGERVAALVRAVSKDDHAMAAWDGLPVPTGELDATARQGLWKRRRLFMLAHVTGSGVDTDVLRLKAADAHANLGAILRDLENPAVGAAVWQRFNVGREESLWFYGAVADAVEAGIGAEPLAKRLGGVLERVRR